jgi:DNA-binding NarL/FixJ family response regulator
MMTQNVSSLRILIADDHPIFRDGLRRLLESEPGMEVVGEAADGDQVPTLTETLRPDVLLLDLAMPRRHGLEALRDLTDGKIAVRVVLLTAAITDEQIVESLQLGARGVVLKESATETLLQAIRTVMSDRYWIGRESVADPLDYLRRLAPARASAQRRRNFGLTPRERQILEAIVSGCSNRQIAERFTLSEQTVKHHLTSIFDKCGVDSRLELALFAIRHQLVAPS